jgi:hypothetical protein
MEIRNQGMINPCDILIAVYNGDKFGGTYNAVSYAQDNRKKIIHIDPNEIGGNHGSILGQFR